VILVLWEVEIGRIAVQSQSNEKKKKLDHMSTITREKRAGGVA
jgi:hypothetical protein